MDDVVTLTLTKTDRKNQLEAREEVRITCRDYLNVPESERNPDVAEQIALAVLDYLEGEEKAEGGAG